MNADKHVMFLPAFIGVHQRLNMSSYRTVGYLIPSCSKYVSYFAAS